MQSKATTVSQYLDSLPADRRAAIEAVRKTIKANLRGYEEGMQYGMIGYYVPHSTYPAGYHCDPKQPLPFAALASQKNHMSVYLMGLYVEGEKSDLAKWFHAAWKKSGKKLDMGKCCVRFKKLEDVPLEVLGEAVRRQPAKDYIGSYEAVLATSKSRKPKAAAKPKVAAKKPKPAAGAKAKSAKR